MQTSRILQSQQIPHHLQFASQGPLITILHDDKGLKGALITGAQPSCPDEVRFHLQTQAAYSGLYRGDTPACPDNEPALCSFTVCALTTFG